MPETTMNNGYSNGSHIHNGYEMENNSSFLFTSESVGEGHPGKNMVTLIYKKVMKSSQVNKEGLIKT